MRPSANGDFPAKPATILCFLSIFRDETNKQTNKVTEEFSNSSANHHGNHNIRAATENGMNSDLSRRGSTAPAQRPVLQQLLCQEVVLPHAVCEATEEVHRIREIKGSSAGPMRIPPDSGFFLLWAFVK